MLDMTPDGEFRRQPGLSLGARIVLAAAVVAVIAGGLAISAFVLGLALALVPVALVAVLVAYLAFRFEVWRARRDSNS